MPFKLITKIVGIDKVLESLREFTRGLIPQSEIDAMGKDRREYERIVSRAAIQLRAGVPVRTGLMRRQTSARQLGPFSTAIYSDATNTKGVEYAQFVDRYASALASVAASTEARILSRSIRVTAYIRVAGRVARRSVNVPVSDFLSSRVEGTRLVVDFRPIGGRN